MGRAKAIEAPSLPRNARELVQDVRASPAPANPVLQDAKTRCPCPRVFRPAAKVRERGCEFVRLSGTPFDRVPKRRTAPPSHAHTPRRQSGSLMGRPRKVARTFGLRLA